MRKAEGKQLIGIIYTSGSLEVAEMISQSGFDWVMIDMEHSVLTLKDVQNSLPVFGKKLLRIVRIPGNDPVWIKRVLDTGCDGIMVPMVNSGEEAEKLVRAAKYPPVGQRSVGITRAHSYGQSFSKYLESANSDLIIMAQIEHRDGVRNIDLILNIKGIDWIFIGPYDMSASMGLAGQVSHPDVRKAIELVKKKCRDSGIPYGIFGASPEALVQEFHDGCKYLLCGIDVFLISTALRDLSGKLKALIKE
ncbi:MAG: aldolase/citrate lyase family protein [Bacteroidota bacterium]|nr:aldolase/citrate lyase family protein [Bacteroidota bacterium]